MSKGQTPLSDDCPLCIQPDCRLPHFPVVAAMVVMMVATVMPVPRRCISAAYGCKAHKGYQYGCNNILFHSDYVLLLV
jgi:hypothetical protein